MKLTQNVFNVKSASKTEFTTTADTPVETARKLGDSQSRSLHINPQPRRARSTWSRLLLTWMLVFCLLPLAPLQAGAQEQSEESPVHPLLLEMAAQQPDEAISVIIQKSTSDSSVEALIAHLGGVVTRDLTFINALGAVLPAGAVMQLAENDGVRWITPDSMMQSTSISASEAAVSALPTVAPLRAPTNLSNGLGGNDALMGDAVAGADGTIHLIFVGKTASKQDIFYTHNRGGAFAAPLNVSKGLGGSDSLAPALAVDANNAVHVVFVGKTGDKKDIFYTSNIGGVFAAPVNLTNRLGGEDANTPKVAVSADGAVHVVLQGKGSKKKDIFYVRSSGGVFAAPLNVSKGLGGEDSLAPAVAADAAGVAHVVFQGKAGSKKDVFYSQNGGGSFAPLVNVSSGLGGNDSSSPAIAVDSSGAVHVVYQGKTGDKIDIFYKRGSAGVFTSPLNVSQQATGSDALAADLAVDSSGAVHVVFQSNRLGRQDVFYVHNRSGSFIRPVNATNKLGGNDSLLPAVVLGADGAPHFLFQGKTGDKLDIFYLKALGATNVSNKLGGNEVFAPAMGVDSSGAAHLVFQGKMDKLDIFYSRNTANARSEFTAPINLSNGLGGNDAFAPRIAVENSAVAHVVFQGEKGSVQDIFYTRINGGAFSPPLNLTNGLGGKDSLAPDVAVDPHGVVHVVFQGNTNGKQDIFYIHNRGGAFSVPANLSLGLGGNDSAAPRLAVDIRAVVHVVFQGKTASMLDLFYTSNRRDDFSTPANISNGLGGNDSLAPALAVDDSGVVQVVFQGKTGATQDIFYSNDAGGGFSLPRNLSNGLGGNHSTAPDVATAPGGGVMVTFQGETGSDAGIFVVDNSTGDFASPVDLVGRTQVDDAFAPVVASGGRSAQVAYLYKTDKFDIFHAPLLAWPQQPQHVAVLTAGPATVGNGSLIDVTLTVMSDEATAGVTPAMGTVDISGHGANAVCGEPTPATQDLLPYQTASFTWSCTAQSGSMPGNMAFEVSTTNAGGAWPEVISDPIQILPVVDPTFVTWATNVGTVEANGFTNVANIVDESGLGPDGVFGYGGAVKGSFAGFEAQVSPGYRINKVRLLLHSYVATPIDKEIKFRLYLSGQKFAEIKVNGHIFDKVVGAAKAGPVLVDVTGSYPWRWGDFSDGLEVVVLQDGLQDSQRIYYDAIGLRVTSAPGDADLGTKLPPTPGDEYIDPNNLSTVFNQVIGASKIWNESPAYLQGQGMTVAVVDSGVAKIKGLDLRKVEDINFNSSYSDSLDRYGHGTFVANVMAGSGKNANGRYIGVAPNAFLLNVRVSDDQGMATEGDVLEALQWIYQNRNEYKIRVINLSLNASVPSSYHMSPLNAAVEMLWFSGVVVVVSAGNNGSADLYAPANDPWVITVGATDDRGTVSLSDDVLAAFSAWGMDETGRAKPDLVAPGANIVTFVPSVDKLSMGKKHESHALNKNYFRMSGTSMAAPMVAGAVALLLQDEPGLTPDQVKYRLMATAQKYWPGYDAQRAGAGYLDIYAAVHGRTYELANNGIAPSELLRPIVAQVLGNDVNWNSVNWNSVNWNSVNWNSVNWNSVNWNSVNWNSVNWNSVNWNSVNWNSVNWNSVSWNSDYWDNSIEATQAALARHMAIETVQPETTPSSLYLPFVNSQR